MVVVACCYPNATNGWWDYIYGKIEYNIQTTRIQYTTTITANIATATSTATTIVRTTSTKKIHAFWKTACSKRRRTCFGF